MLLSCVVKGWCPKYVPYVLINFDSDFKWLSIRCMARPDELHSSGTRQTHKHTRQLLDSFDLNTLWDDYGIVGDLVVSSIID